MALLIALIKMGWKTPAKRHEDCQATDSVLQALPKCAAQGLLRFVENSFVAFL